MPVSSPRRAVRFAYLAFAAAGTAVADSFDFAAVAQVRDSVTTLSVAPALPNLVFVAERNGRVEIVDGGVVQATPFLDLTDRVRSSGFEQGLTGFAPAPGFPATPYVYVHYTRADNASVLARYTLLPGPTLAADPASQLDVLVVPQPDPVHNCNEVAFGPDGYLYFGCGDGGPTSGPVFDPKSVANLYGKILRLDLANVPAGRTYGIPSDNPFVGVAGAAPEVWAYGLRNPYHFSFDASNGDLWIADVGQATWEEVDYVPAGTPAGRNFGWNRMEGRHCYPGNVACDRTDLVLPVIEYSHADGCAIVGGPRVRNAALPALEGRYLYADFCSGEVYAAQQIDKTWTSDLLVTLPKAPTAIAMTGAGEVWIGSYGNGAALLFRLRMGDSIFADDFGEDEE